MVTIVKPKSTYADRTDAQEFLLEWSSTVSGQYAYEIYYKLINAAAWSTTGVINSTDTTYDLRQIYDLVGVDFVEVTYKVKLYYSTTNAEGALTGTEESDIYTVIFSQPISGYLNVYDGAETEQYPLFSSISNTEYDKFNVQTNDGKLSTVLVDDSSPIASDLKLRVGEDNLSLASSYADGLTYVQNAGGEFDQSGTRSGYYYFYTNPNSTYYYYYYTSAQYNYKDNPSGTYYYYYSSQKTESYGLTGSGTYYYYAKDSNSYNYDYYTSGTYYYDASKKTYAYYYKVNSKPNYYYLAYYTLVATSVGGTSPSQYGYQGYSSHGTTVYFYSAIYKPSTDYYYYYSSSKYYYLPTLSDTYYYKTAGSDTYYTYRQVSDSYSYNYYAYKYYYTYYKGSGSYYYYRYLYGYYYSKWNPGVTYYYYQKNSTSYSQGYSYHYYT